MEKARKLGFASDVFLNIAFIDFMLVAAAIDATPLRTRLVALVPGVVAAVACRIFNAMRKRSIAEARRRKRWVASRCRHVRPASGKAA